MALRPATSGSTPVANLTAQFGQYGVVKFTEQLPQAIGGCRASYFSRAAATRNPMNANGWRNPSAYSGTLEKTEAFFMDYARSNGSVFGRNSFFIGIAMYAGIPAYPGCCSSDLSRARNKALLELKDQTVNLSLAWKERQDTIDMVTSCIKTAAGIVKGVKSYLKNPRKRKELRRKLVGKWKDAPEAWLMYRYGMLPTMLDAYGACEALDKRDNGSYERYMCTVRGKSTTAYKGKRLSLIDTYLGRYYPMPGKVETLLLPGSYGARVRYDCALTNANYLRFSEVGVTNPLEIIWEGISFSFVADWFSSVGDWCSALDATVPFTFIGGTETIFVNWSGRTVLTSTAGSITIHSGGSPGSGRKFNRSVVSSFPWPTPFVLKKDPLNVVRLADALSLLSSLCK